MKGPTRFGFRGRSNLSGFSLVEVMVAMLVFSSLVGLLFSASIFSQRTAYGNIYRNSAYTIVQGYAEQIKSIGYTSIEAALDDPVNEKIPTMALSLLGTVANSDLEIDDPLIFGQSNEKQILVDVEIDENGDPTGNERVMTLWISPEGSRIPGRDAIEISLQFSWNEPGVSDRVFSDTIRIIKTDISEY